MEERTESLVEIANSKFGKGLFTKKGLSKGTVICKITGPPISFFETIKLKERESHTLQIDIEKYIYCEPPFLYSNHSCNPNCGVNENFEMFTLKQINAGQELFWDYSTSMLERQWTMQCNCGEKNCRKIITDFDLLPHSVQEKYLQQNIVFSFIVKWLKHNYAKTG